MLQCVLQCVAVCVAVCVEKIGSFSGYSAVQSHIEIYSTQQVIYHELIHKELHELIHTELHASCMYVRARDRVACVESKQFFWIFCFVIAFKWPVNALFFSWYLERERVRARARARRGGRDRGRKRENVCVSERESARARARARRGEREIERERERMCVSEREREREREYMCVRERVCV